MSSNARKCVLVIAEDLPTGQAINAAGVLAVTLGQRAEGLVGPDVTDGSGHSHAGLIHVPLPVLKAAPERIKEIRERTVGTDDLLVVDMTEPAQIARTYTDYTERLAATPAENLTYLGIGLYGSRKTIEKLTGGLPLLR